MANEMEEIVNAGEMRFSTDSPSNHPKAFYCYIFPVDKEFKNIIELNDFIRTYGLLVTNNNGTMVEVK